MNYHSAFISPLHMYGERSNDQNPCELKGVHVSGEQHLSYKEPELGLTAIAHQVFMSQGPRFRLSPTAHVGSHSYM